MSYFDQSIGTGQRAASSGFSDAVPFLSSRTCLTISLVIFCAAAHIFLTYGNTTSENVQLGAAHPDLRAAKVESPTVESPTVKIPVVNSSAVNSSAVDSSAVDSSAVESAIAEPIDIQPPVVRVPVEEPPIVDSTAGDSTVAQSAVVQASEVSRWINRHLDNRHYASTTSLANSSDLDFLCIEGVSCGWFVNLVDESNCNKTTRGREFRVRVESDQVVRDFQSRCVGYGLVFVGTESGEEETITGMVKRSDSLRVNSVSKAGIIKTQKFDSRGSSDALEIAVRAAGLESDLKVSDNTHR